MHALKMSHIPKANGIKQQKQQHIPHTQRTL